MMKNLLRRFSAPEAGEIAIHQGNEQMGNWRWQTSASPAMCAMARQRPNSSVQRHVAMGQQQTQAPQQTRRVIVAIPAGADTIVMLIPWNKIGGIPS
jgi:hypothetical protein